MGNNSVINSITCTVIFDGSALNRDEKIGNSILSIKKLTYHGDIRPFISKNAIRHYLFNTLNRFANWGKTPILAQGSGDKQTMQLNLTEADIISFEELAVFGYMFTKSGEGALTRKSPLGITKAIALSNYNQDMAFYANHDFVHRMQDVGKKANPNPINKEEHSGLFKLSFTLDADMIGKDSWIVKKEEITYDETSNTLKIILADPQKFILTNCYKKIDDDGNELIIIKDDKNDEFEITINGALITIPEKLLKSKDVAKGLTINPEFASDRVKSGNSYKTAYKFKITDADFDETSKNYTFECSNLPILNDDRTVVLELGYEKKLQNIICPNLNMESKENIFHFTNHDNKFGNCQIKLVSLNIEKPSKGPFKLEFVLSEKKKKQIMQQVLFVIKNGLMAQSSNELNTIKPLFILAADVKVPMPVFHADIDVKKEDGKLKVIGVKDAIDNGWLLENIYIQCNERLSMIPLNDNRIKSNWNEFLSAVKLGNNESSAN